MNERRKKRSRDPREAIGLLLDTVRTRSDVSAIAVVNGQGAVVSGTGSARELEILAAVAAPAAHGYMGSAYDRLTSGTDVLARAIDTNAGTWYLAALGARVSRMVEAARAVERIVRHVP
jgi:hypothetical protein